MHFTHKLCAPNTRSKNASNILKDLKIYVELRAIFQLHAELIERVRIQNTVLLLQHKFGNSTCKRVPEGNLDAPQKNLTRAYSTTSAANQAIL